MLFHLMYVTFFRNSIDHLHLHAISLPETKNWGGYFKYMQGMPWCKSAQAVIEELRSRPDRVRDPIHLYSLNQFKGTENKDS